MLACTWWHKRWNTQLIWVNMTQCYKKFTIILTGESLGKQSNLQLSDRGSDGNSTGIYPEVCRFCKKGRIIQREENGSSKKVDLKEAQWLTKPSTREIDSKRFYKTEHLNLTTKNFWFHKRCKKDFTRSKKSSNRVSCIFLPK